MSAAGRVRAWLRAVVRRDQMERQMRDEMSAHMEQAAERFVARGMSRHEARIAAQREFGPVGLLQENARDARGGQWIDNLRRDVKYAFRRRPHLVDEVEGFVRMEVISPHDKPQEIWLLTFWADQQSFEQWHHGHLYRESHKGIPRGLKLVPGETKLLRFEHVCS